MNYRPPKLEYELWDSWVIMDGDTCHLFHLCRDWWSGDDVRRNYVGHATSRDCLHWTTHDDITLFSASESDWDSNQRILTGNTFRDRDGTFHMTYGSAKPEKPGGPAVAKIGIASSDDLFSWRKSPANPILSPEPPYRASDDERWPLRDASVCRTPDGRYEAIFCTRMGEGPFSRRGVIGRALSDDLVRWEYVDPLLQTDRIQEPEVPSRYEREGRHYLLFCAGFGLAGRTHYDHYPVIDKATYYAVADTFDGPFRFSMQNVLTPGTAYVGRIVDVGGEPLYFHHVQTRRSGFAIPKAVRLEGDRITLGPWSGIEAIFTGRAQAGFADVAAVADHMPAVVRDAEIVFDASDGPVIAETRSQWRDVHLSLVMEPRCEFAGVRLRGNDSKQALAVIYERDADRLIVTRVERAMRYRALPYTFADLLGIYERAKGPASRLDITLTVRSDAIDVFLDGSHVLTVTVEGVGCEGPVALYADGGACSFHDLVIRELEPEPNFYPDVERP